MIAQFIKVLGSQAGLALVGLVTLPVIARNYQAEVFGEFSLFLVLVGSISLVDFCRPVLIRQYAEYTAPNVPPSSSGIAVVNVIVVTAVAAMLGAVLLRSDAAIALALICCLHALASPDYADNANVHGAGDIQMYRNVTWALAYLSVSVSGFFSSSPFTYLLPFLAANAILIYLYRKMASRPYFQNNLTQVPRIDRQTLRDAWHVLSFNVISAFVTSIDKVALGRFVDADLYGRYMAQSSLALKGNLAGTALGQTIYPQLANLNEQQGADSALEYFSRVFSFAMLALGTSLLLPIYFSRQVIDILFGSEYSTSFDIFSLVLVGVHLQMLGILLTPWQRAQGDFSTARNAYLIAAIVMLAGAILLIPRFGVAGAVGVYLSGRVGDLILFAHAFPALKRTHSFRRYGPWILVNFAVLAGLATYRFV